MGWGGGTLNRERFRVGRWTTNTFKEPHFVIFYMLISGGFVTGCLQVIANGVLDPRLTWAERVLFSLRQPVALVHTLKTVKGLLLLVPSRTPRSRGYDVYTHTVYVVICYMSITCICLLYVVICYMSDICYMCVICLVLGPSCYMYMSVICCYVLYVVMCYMSVICLVLGGVVGLGYILSNAHLCNHMILQSGGGTWDTTLYTVRGVGSESRDVDACRANGCTPRIGDSKYRCPWIMVPSPPVANPHRFLIRGSDIGFR